MAFHGVSLDLIAYVLHEFLCQVQRPYTFSIAVYRCKRSCGTMVAFMQYAHAFVFVSFFRALDGAAFYGASF